MINFLISSKANKVTAKGRAASHQLNLRGKQLRTAKPGM
jgi:hypothetical protein